MYTAMFQVRAWIVLTAMFFTGLVFVGASSAQAATPPPPPPTAYDRSGSDQDEFTVPAVDGVQYLHPSGYPYYFPGINYPTNGATSVEVVADYKNDGIMTRSSPYLLTFSPEVTGEEAANVYSFSFGACDSDLKQTAMTATVTNTDDVTDRYMGSEGELWIDVYDHDTFRATEKFTSRIEDGATFAARVGNRSSYEIGIAWGSSDVTFYYMDGAGTITDVLYRGTVQVPSCGTGTDPDPDPPPSVTSKKPTASITFRYRKAVVRFGTRGVLPKAGSTRFKVVIDPRRGRTRVGYPLIHNDRSAYRTYYRIRKGTVVKVFYRSKSHRYVFLAGRRR